MSTLDRFFESYRSVPIAQAKNINIFAVEELTLLSEESIAVVSFNFGFNCKAAQYLNGFQPPK